MRTRQQPVKRRDNCGYFLNTLDAALAASVSSTTGYFSNSNRLSHPATCCATISFHQMPTRTIMTFTLIPHSVGL
jgi:hypothetical protein